MVPNNRQLKPESTRAFFEQSLQIVDQDSLRTSRFLILTILSRKFLNCSAFKRYNIYRFVLHDAKVQPMFFLSRKSFEYLREKYWMYTSRSFALSYNQARCLLCLLRPPTVELYASNNRVTREFRNLADLLLNSATGHVVFHSELELNCVAPLISRCWPKIVEFGYNPTLIPNHLLSERKLAACKLYSLKSLGQLKETLHKHKIKKLSAEISLNGQEGLQMLMRNEKIHGDQSNCKSLRHLDLKIFSNVSFKLISFLDEVKTFSPKLDSISIQKHFFASTFSEEATSSVIVEKILHLYYLLCELDTYCSQVFSHVSINFCTNFSIIKSTENQDWMCQLAKQLKITHLETFPTFHFITLETKKSASSLLFKVDAFETVV